MQSLRPNQRRHMLKTLLMAFALLLLADRAYNQTFAINGSIADTSTRADLKNAVVSLLKTKDSVLLKYQRISANGSFSFKNIDTGHYVLLITHPGFADYADIISVNKNLDLGNIFMLTRAKILQDVIVRGSPIRMKGDTLAYVADSFKVKEGATVEDLLKKLPGIQVNSKGEITAQGEKVEKVLVDGEEFFGDDPTLATQNLIAKSVKEVQVFDKKSDQAAFTGVDDGQKTKTINLKLKDEYKKGYFGKLKLAGGIPDRWQNSGMINRFNDKQKISVYGKMANSNDIGLGWGEENQYGGGIGVESGVSDDGGIYMMTTSDEFGGGGSNYYGTGLPRSWLGGASYSTKWNENKNSMNGAIRYQKMITEGTTTTNTQTILPDTQYFNNETAVSKATRWRTRGNMRSDIAIDSLQSLTITADGSQGGNQLYSLLKSEALTSSKFPVNKNQRLSTADGTNGSFNSNILFKKKFAKKGRTFSFNLSEKYSTLDNNGYLLSALDLYGDGLFLRTDTIDQKKITSNHNITVDARATYTEPVGKRAIVEFSYGYGVANAEQQLLSYDKVNGKYDELNQVFSNHYKFNTGTHRGGIAYRYNYKKLTFGFGSDASHATWKQTDLFIDTTRKYSFNNLFPKANFAYKLGQYSRVSFNYNGRTQAPSINQIQPVANNADPLNIAVGNPDLKQSFTNQFQLNYNFYQVLKEQGLFSGLNFNQVNNAFSSRDSIDTLGRRIYKTVNVNGNYNFGGYLGYNFSWKKKEIRFNLQGSPNVSRIVNFVNGLRNVNQNVQLSFNAGAGQYKDKKYSWNVNIETGYNYGKSSIRKDVVTKFWTATPHGEVNITLPKNFEFSTDANYNWRQKTSVFNPINTFIWNAGFTKKVSKKQDLKLGFEIHDILNQNVGFQRDVSSNYIVQKSYDVIKRYWLLTLQWNFNKGPKKDEGW
jgi:hypothetical protein